MIIFNKLKQENRQLKEQLQELNEQYALLKKEQDYYKEQGLFIPDRCGHFEPGDVLRAVSQGTPGLFIKYENYGMSSLVLTAKGEISMFNDCWERIYRKPKKEEQNEN